MSRIINTVPWRRWYFILLMGGAIALIWALLHGGGGNNNNGNQAGQRYGFNDLALGIPAIPRATLLSKLAGTHATYYRTNLSWQYYEPTEGNINQAFLPDKQNAYNALLANGQTPIFIVLGTPYWAAKTGTTHVQLPGFACANNQNQTICDNPPDVRKANVDTAWQNFLKAAAKAMPKAVFEIWNEPNLPYSWFIDQDPQLYGLMLKSAVSAIHSASPGTTVISGSMNGYDGPDSTTMTSEKTFLEQMYPASGTSFDGLGFHAYPCNGQAHYTDSLDHTIGVIRAARDAAGDHNKPLWLTELGATSSAQTSAANCNTTFTEQQQADALRDSVAWAKQQNDTSKDLPVLLIHTLFDNNPRMPTGSNLDPSAAPPKGSEDEFGLIAWTKDTANNTIQTYDKPALAKVTCEFAGSAVC